MIAENADTSIARIAAAIAEPARTRMLCCLLDGHARTSTELAVVGEVSPSTASVHLARLKEQQLVSVLAQGKHRYYSLAGPHVAAALEALQVLGGAAAGNFKPNTPVRLRTARTCYDHMAGEVAVLMHDHFVRKAWLAPHSGDAKSYDLTQEGEDALDALGLDITLARTQRRRFACACLDWSERRPHLGGALGAALLKTSLKRKWVTQDLDSRALQVTRLGERELRARFTA